MKTGAPGHYPVNKESALAGFTYCYEKKNETRKIVVDADTAEGASEENFNKPGAMQL